MKNSKKVALIGLLLAPTMLTGCNGLGGNDDLEVVEEWIVAEEGEDSDSEEYTDKDIEVNKKEEISNKEPQEKEEASKDIVAKEDEKVKEEAPKEDKKDTVEQEVVLVSNPVFTKSDITDDIKDRMTGKSMPVDANMSFDELSYLTITYLDYDGKTRQGEMVVNKKLADEVLDIFKDIYLAKFPIQRMNLVDDYGASDHASMVNNNTSAFCYRTIAGTNKISNHGKGMAIDINPFYNPHVLKNSGKVNPPEASKYSNRSLSEKGMIKYNDVVYKAFTSRGWKWGGHWNNPDYQHFEKSI